MTQMGLGFVVGVVLAVMVALSWKSAVTSGDAFSLGEQFYACEKVKVIVE